MWKWNQPNTNNQQHCVLFLFDWLTQELATSGQAHTEITTESPNPVFVVQRGIRIEVDDRGDAVSPVPHQIRHVTNDRAVFACKDKVSA